MTSLLSARRTLDHEGAGSGSWDTRFRPPCGVISSGRRILSLRDQATDTSTFDTETPSIPMKVNKPQATIVVSVRKVPLESLFDRERGRRSTNEAPPRHRPTSTHSRVSPFFSFSTRTSYGVVSRVHSTASGLPSVHVALLVYLPG